MPNGKQISYDDDGFPVEKETFIEHIPCSFKDTTRNDGILANQLGYKADVEIEMMACNYNGQRYLIDEQDGTKYEVKRTYKKDSSKKIYLTCEKVVV